RSHEFCVNFVGAASSRDSFVQNRIVGAAV
ncbi:MAG: hypothetical protein ACI88G_000430, partial [Woeseiaceae bacterium]